MSPDLVDGGGQLMHLAQEREGGHLLLDVIGDTVGELQHVCLIPKEWHQDLAGLEDSNQKINLFNPCAEVIQGIRVNVTKCNELCQVKILDDDHVCYHKGHSQTSSVGIGALLRFTKKTPLFFRALGQSVWTIRWPAAFWEITID